MKAAVVPKIGSKWEVREVPTPEPSANQVLIKIRASGLCYTDVHMTEGRLSVPIEFPRTIGHEPVGEVVTLGEGVTTRKVGDRVGVPYSSIMRKVRMVSAWEADVLCTAYWDRYRHSRKPR